MTCTSCGTELLPEARFCYACGAAVATACKTCGSPLRPEYRFCPTCGTAVGGAEAPRSTAAPSPPPPPPSDPWAAAGLAMKERLGRLSRHIPQDLAQKIRDIQSTIAGERKLVTVLFCDLVGSTAIAEKLDPEEYRDLLDQYLELAFHQIYRFEGIVNQLAGDGMMALFGAPVAHEDAPYRAVRAAVEIQIALGEFNRRLASRRGFELRARIGIHTGPVVVGTVGNDLKMDYTAIGDTTNLTARLQSLAAPGTILVSDATYRLVHGFFRVQPAGPFEVKGKAEPVTAYEVLGRSDITTALGVSAARGLTPLVGRPQELTQLGDCFARVRGNLPQIVTIVGDAGSGKSRLLYEFRQSLTPESVVFFEGRCAALKQKVSYSPFVVMLRQFFGVSVSDPPEHACERIGAKVRDFDPDLDEIYPFLCRMLGVTTAAAELPADEIKRETFHALTRLVSRVSLRTPVVLVIEDLHWIDDASRELLELSVAQLTRARLMMAFTHRPDFHAAWRPQVALTQLSLRPLSDDDTRSIVRAVAGATLPADLESRILAKAEGSPFFAEEITRALFEEGFLVVEDGRARLTRPIEEVAIPGTVREVIAARLDRLGGPAKRVVQAASVLGRQFHRIELVQLLDEEGIDVPTILDDLEDRGILHRKSVLSDDEYRFGESLTQEVAYDGLLHKQRRQMHERIGLLLQATDSPRTAERFALLAHHFVRSDNRRKAIETLLEAARLTEALPSYRTAADLYRQAWELGHASLAEGAEVDEDFRKLVLDACLNLCRMAVVYVAPDSLDVETAARFGRDLAEAVGDVDSAAGFRAYHGMIVMSGGSDRFEEGFSLVESGHRLAEKNGLAETALSISRALAFGCLFDGQIDRARAIADHLLAALEARGHHERLTDLYFGTIWLRNSTIVYGGDDVPGAIADAARCHDLAVRANNRTSRSGMAAVLGQLYFTRGEYEPARRWADESLEIAESIGNVTTMRTAASIALGARAALGETFDPGRYLKDIEDGLSMASNLSLYVRVVVDVLLSTGELRLAERAARLAYDRAGGRLRHAFASIALGDVLSHLGEETHGEAIACYESAVALAREVGVRSTLAHARLGLGRLAAMNGDPGARERHLSEASRLFGELGLARYSERAERLRSGAAAGLAESA